MTSRRKFGVCQKGLLKGEPEKRSRDTTQSDQKTTEGKKKIELVGANTVLCPGGNVEKKKLGPSGKKRKPAVFSSNGIGGRWYWSGRERHIGLSNGTQGGSGIPQKTDAIDAKVLDGTVSND